jgi:hypothetical protein
MLTNKMSTEAVATASGSGSCVCVVRRGPEHNANMAGIEDVVTVYVARRYRLPVPVARIVAELAGIGARIG